MAAMKRTVARLPVAIAPYAGPAQAIGLITEDAVAQQFAKRHADQLLYCHSTGAWFRWTGSIWRQQETQLAFHLARELARELTRCEEEKVQLSAGKTAFAGGVERFCRADPTFARTADFWDQDGFLAGTPTGTLDLRTGRLRTANPADGITKSLAVAPADTANCPLWRNFLGETFRGDDSLIRFIQQFLGYSLTGDISEHALLFGCGPGGNGKGVLINTVTGVLADYAVVAAMDTFTTSYSDKHPTDLARLRGARFVTASETERDKPWAEARIKQLTGGDKISARFMRQDFFEFWPQFKLMIVGNHKPALHTVDDAARRRFNIVPFENRPLVPDPDLQDKLRAEWPAILRWMIEGALDWQANRLARPPVVQTATEVYFSDQDVFGQ
jgi:putative DNA primase/helicase